MSIFIDKKTRVLVQGITGKQASFHVKKSMDYGTKIVAGVTPRKGGSKHLGVPVFNTIREAISETKATASLMFVPARQVLSAVIEGVEAEIDTMVCITEHVPVRDMLEIKAVLRGSKTKLIGPNTPGIITPGQARLGVFPINIHKPGRIGVVSRSSTLTYAAVIETTLAGLGQSTVVGLGDDMMVGTDFIDVLKAFHEDKNTDVIVMVGKIGGQFEEVAAEYYKTIPNKKPIVAFVAGSAVPFGHDMGYAGELLSYGKHTVQDKIDVMRKAGIIVMDNSNDIHKELQKIIGKC